MKFKETELTVPEIDMTPMIDIVFQLIAFFMVITNFEQTQADERVKLPRDVLAKVPEVKRETKFVLNFGFERDQEGDKKDDEPFVFYNGELFRVLDFKKNLDLEARMFKDQGDAVKDVSVILRADKEVPTGLVQELIKQAQEAGFEKFAMSATQQSQ
jgi:biopolymer transport protein ExbD